VADKLHWTFKLYDKDGNGEIGEVKIFFIRINIFCKKINFLNADLEEMEEIFTKEGPI
jgi:Ca2+-binding EF-hand superfamily protein